MMNKLLLSGGLCAAMSFAAPVFGAEKETKTEIEVKVPDTPKAIWAEIDAKHKELTEALAAKKAKEVHTLCETIEGLTKGLPGKSSDLPADKLKRVEGQVKNIARVLDDLHEAADAGKFDAAEAKLKQVDAALKIMRSQYPAS